jgi:DNA polymerase
MERIARKVRICTKCPLWQGRRNAVPGEGNVDAAVMFVGEAPGYWEDFKGVPFVGAAGKVLDGLLEMIKLSRGNVFITNVVKCRPPENRGPRQLEVTTCTSLYLDRQIGLIQPKIIVALGRHSTAYIFSKAGLEKVENITELHGKVFKINLLGFSVSVIPMYHPASVLHNPRYRDKLEEDFRLLRSELEKCRIL